MSLQAALLCSGDGEAALLLLHGPVQQARQCTAQQRNDDDAAHGPSGL